MSCSSIDDDLSDCGPTDVSYSLSYEMKLVTNISTELTTKLTTAADLKVRAGLAAHLAEIFTDQAHDVNLSFYDTEGDSVRLYQKTDIIDESRKVYTLELPMREYMHTCIANVADNKLVSVADDDHCHPARLVQTDGETIDSHTTGLFTARLPMHVLENVSQTFNVRLYMANSAAALVIDTTGVKVNDIALVTTGFATGFSICDSIYHHAATPPLVRAREVAVPSSLASAPARRAGDGAADATREVCYCSVNFPSAATGGWQYKVYVTLTDDTITETVLTIPEPLLAGDLHIQKVRLHDNGSVTTSDPTVGVSITLDWNDGGHHDVDL